MSVVFTWTLSRNIKSLNTDPLAVYWCIGQWPPSPSCEIFILLSPLASTPSYPGAWNNRTSLPNDAIIQRKKKTGLLCRFKFRNRREESDNGRALRRQSYSRVKRLGGGGVGSVCFSAFHVQKSSEPLQCLHAKKLLTLTYAVCKWKLPGTVSLAVPALFVARLLLHYLIMKNNSLGVCWILFSPKTLWALWIRALIRCRDGQRDGRKQWQMNRRYSSNGVSTSEAASPRSCV